MVGNSELIALKTAPIGNLVIIYSKWAKNHLSDFATLQELTDSWPICFHQNEKSRHLDSNAVTLQNSR